MLGWRARRDGGRNLSVWQMSRDRERPAGIPGQQCRCRRPVVPVLLLRGLHPACHSLQQQLLPAAAALLCPSLQSCRAALVLQQSLLKVILLQDV